MNFPRVVYAIRHEPTGKIYVGSTSKLCDRLSNHFTALKGGYHKNEAMQRDYNEHGFSYTVFILDFVSDFQDRNKEFLWIDALGTRNPDAGYNAGDNSKTAESSLRDGFTVGDCCSIPAIQQLMKNSGKLKKFGRENANSVLWLEV